MSLQRSSRALRRRMARRENASGFGLRLFLSVAMVLAVIGVGGYLAVAHELEREAIATFVADQRADARTFEAKGRENPRTAIREVAEVLEAVGSRPGTVEAVLIDPRGRVVAAAEEDELGERSDDDRVRAALTRGRSFAGKELDEGENAENFEVIVPVDLPQGRHALEVAHDHEAFQDELRDVRTTMLLVGLLGLLGAGGLFYLVGGRSLIESHRIALQRATRDGLTDLPNQRAFHDEFPRAVASAGRYGDSLALVVLDLDDFKFINDRYGHPRGDALLQSVAAVLRDGRSADRPYRIGGDEFALLLPHTDAEGARSIARRMCRAFASAEAAVSLGVSVLRPGEADDELRAEADAALYEAKRRGGHQVVHFEDIREQVTVTTSDKREAVRRLIAEGSLTTVFQPIWALPEQRLIGIEALTRPDPALGLSGPAEAFDVAEELSRVHELDVLCARRALAAAPELPEGTLLFLNLAPQTLELDSSGNDWLHEAVEGAGIPVEHVVVEVTERFGGRTASVIKGLNRLREQGFQVALDDVGTGNSGLEMLRRVDAEYVKLDRSIVSAAASEPNARGVLLAMATFARQTGAFVIAEGIEDEETLRFLADIDRDDLRQGPVIQGGQGFGLGEPAHRLPASLRAALAPVSDV